MAERKTGFFDGMEFADFWDDNPYYARKYTEPSPDDGLIAEVEAELGFRLPDSFIELARIRNGGGVKRNRYPMTTPTGWASDHIAITGIYSIGRTATWSLLGELGSTCMRDDWGYPEWGVGFADTPSGGHEQIMFDYRQCGAQGEPSVVYVDQEADYRVAPVAPDFATFICGLVSKEPYEEALDAEFLAQARKAVQRGGLSPILRSCLDAAPDLPDGEALLRRLAGRIVTAKGSFSLYGDDDSYLMYDAIFWLYSKLKLASSFDDYFDRAEGQTGYALCHRFMLRSSIVADPYGFCTGGYSESFVRDWWDQRIASGDLVLVDGGYRFADAYAAAIPNRLRAVS